MTKNYLFTSFLFLICFPKLQAQIVKANFTAKESAKEIYRQGFDSQEEFKDWELQSTDSSHTWHIATEPNISGIPSFSAINADSKNSLAIWYSDEAEQDEIITSPEILIPEGGKCSFYACFDGVFVLYANLTLTVTDGLEEKELFNAFSWAQETGHERPKWLPFILDLTEFANKKVKFSFRYKGRGGDDVLIDDFIISQEDYTGESTAIIDEGSQVHFTDLSTGNPTSYVWTFEGGEPSTSTEQNPVVTYQKAGAYPVKLAVSNSVGSDECERAGFVIVRSIAPTAVIGFPEEGYLSPWVACFIPIGTEVHFTDCSKGNPDTWNWQLQGSDKEICSDQNPTVSYPHEGLYSLSLTVGNTAGTHSVVYEHALQVGGEQYIWNVEMDESENLAPIDLSFYGYYGGTNWLDINAFAERFDKPSVKGLISGVAVYFASVETVTPDALITVSIAREENGLPGEILASAEVRADELKYSDDTFEATYFKFTKATEVDDAFFIIISGFPNNSTEKGIDAIAMFCSPRRENGGKSTVYHQLAILDENYQPTGELEWTKNNDEFLSFAVCPLFAFNDKSSSIHTGQPETTPHIYVSDEILHIDTSKTIQSISIYTITGQKIYTNNHPLSSLSVKGWKKGIYMVEIVINGKNVVQKILIG